MSLIVLGAAGWKAYDWSRYKGDFVVTASEILALSADGAPAIDDGMPHEIHAGRKVLRLQPASGVNRLMNVSLRHDGPSGSEEVDLVADEHGVHGDAEFTPGDHVLLVSARDPATRRRVDGARFKFRAESMIRSVAWNKLYALELNGVRLDADSGDIPTTPEVASVAIVSLTGDDLDLVVRHGVDGAVTTEGVKLVHTGARYEGRLAMRPGLGTISVEAAMPARKVRADRTAFRVRFRKPGAFNAYARLTCRSFDGGALALNILSGAATQVTTAEPYIEMELALVGRALGDADARATWERGADQVAFQERLASGAFRSTVPLLTGENRFTVSLEGADYEASASFVVDYALKPKEPATQRSPESPPATAPSPSDSKANAKLAPPVVILAGREPPTLLTNRPVLHVDVVGKANGAVALQIDYGKQGKTIQEAWSAPFDPKEAEIVVRLDGRETARLAVPTPDVGAAVRAASADLPADATYILSVEVLRGGTAAPPLTASIERLMTPPTVMLEESKIRWDRAIYAYLTGKATAMAEVVAVHAAKKGEVVLVAAAASGLRLNDLGGGRAEVVATGDADGIAVSFEATDAAGNKSAPVGTRYSLSQMRDRANVPVFAAGRPRILMMPFLCGSSELRSKTDGIYVTEPWEPNNVRGAVMAAKNPRDLRKKVRDQLTAQLTGAQFYRFEDVDGLLAMCVERDNSRTLEDVLNGNFSKAIASRMAVLLQADYLITGQVDLEGNEVYGMGIRPQFRTSLQIVDAKTGAVRGERSYVGRGDANRVGRTVDEQMLLTEAFGRYVVDLVSDKLSAGDRSNPE